MAAASLAGDKPIQQLDRPIVTLNAEFTSSGAVFVTTDVSGLAGLVRDEWVAFENLIAAEVAIEPGVHDIITKPSLFRDRIISLIELEGPSTMVGENAFRVMVENRVLWDLQPFDNYTPFPGYEVDPSLFRNRSRVDFTFEDDRITKVQLNFGELFQEAIVAGGSPLFGERMSVETVAITYDGDLVFAPLPGSEGHDGGQERAPVYETGDCFTDAALEQAIPEPISCDEPHTIEVYESGDFDDGPDAAYPGFDALFAPAQQACEVAFVDLTGVEIAASIRHVEVLAPSQEGWDEGDRRFLCYVYDDPEVRGPLAATNVRRSETRVSQLFTQTGDCIATENLEERVYDLVRCDEPHFYEVYHHRLLDDERYPGEAPLNDIARSECAAEFDEFVGITYAESMWLIEWLIPTEATWNELNDRVLTCKVTTYELVEGSAAGSVR